MLIFNRFVRKRTQALGRADGTCQINLETASNKFKARISVVPMALAKQRQTASKEFKARI